MRLRWWLTISTVLTLVSFGLWAYVFTHLWPNPLTILALPNLLFLGFMFFTLASASIPMFAYFNYRFAKLGWLERDRFRLLRQGAWAGGLALLLAYLHLVRALTLIIGLVLLVIFILIEVFFLTRE
jgi:hypothetical protein